MGDPDVGSPRVWDGRGAARPERVARRQRVARLAAALALAIAVPTVVGSSAGWWSSETAAGRGSAASGVSLADGGVGPGGSLVGDPLGQEGGGGGSIEAGLVGLSGELLDVGVDLDDGCADGPDGEPVLLGVVSEPSNGADAGLSAGVEPLAVRVARRMAALVNCAGGVLGRPVEVLVADAAGSPVAARNAVTGLVGRGVSVMIGPSSTPLAVRVAEAVAGRVPVLFPLSVEPALDDRDRGLFLLGPDVVALSEFSAERARARGWRTAAVLAASDPLDDLAATSFADAFAAGGGTVTARLPVLATVDGEVDLGDQLGRLGGGADPQPPPDVVFSPTDLVTLVELRRALVSAGLDVPVVGLDRRQPIGPFTTVSFDGVMVVGRGSVEPAGRVDRLLALVGSAGGGATDPLAAARLADAVLVALDAIVRADRSAAEAVAGQLGVGLTIQGVTGPVGVWRDQIDAGTREFVPVLDAVSGGTGGGTVPAGSGS